jgi:hypothetical protein
MATEKGYPYLVNKNLQMTEPHYLQSILDGLIKIVTTKATKRQLSVGVI